MPQNLVTCRSSIVGAYYRPTHAKSLLYNSYNGDEVLLVRDRGNEFDSMAVKVSISGVHVGWMARSDAQRYGRAMDIAKISAVKAKIIDIFGKYPTIAFQLPLSAVEGAEVEMVQAEFGD